MRFLIKVIQSQVNETPDWLTQLFFERQHRPALREITFMPVYLPWRGYEMSTLLDADHSISIFVDLTPNGLRIFGVAESTQ